MRPLNLPVLAMYLATVLLASAGCEKPLTASPAATAAPPAPAASAVTTIVALPDFTALVKKEGPAVVNISTTQKIQLRRSPFPEFPGLSPDDPFYEFFRRFAPDETFPREFSSQSLGSGFIIGRDGHILTNAHVIENADEITVRLIDKREFKAKVTGADKRSDVALLKISASDLPVVSIGDSSRLEVGEWVAAIGSPFGFTNSVSQGIVSAKGRSLPGENIVPFIQTDVPINPGNSGGPLFNMKGEVVGINSQIYSRSGGYMGLSFAIPIDLAMKIKDELLQHGTVRRGWLGVRVQDVDTEHAKAFGLAKPGGALVASVEKESPADRAGLELGDIILKLNGNELAGADDLARAVAGVAPGSNIRLNVWRHGASREITVTLGEADTTHTTRKAQQKEADPNQLGLALRELSRDEKRALHTDGNLFVDEAGGVAAESGIRHGDIVLAVNSQRVSSIQQFRAALAQAGKHAALLVQREGVTIFFAIKRKDE